MIEASNIVDMIDDGWLQDNITTSLDKPLITNIMVSDSKRRNVSSTDLILVKFNEIEEKQLGHAYKYVDRIYPCDIVARTSVSFDHVLKLRDEIIRILRANKFYYNTAWKMLITNIVDESIEMSLIYQFRIKVKVHEYGVLID